jgi:hypothetical protein
VIGKEGLGRPFLTTSFADPDRFKAGARRRLEIDWLKANPNKASAGIAVSSFHLLTAFFQKETATQFAFEPYRGVARAGAGPGGRSNRPFVQYTGCPATDRSIKAYATTSDTRLALGARHPDLW